MIWFHGTTKENAEVILREGFKEGTYFGQHLEDALHMGGDYIFEVWLDLEPVGNWEYVAPERIPPESIRYLYSIVPTLLHQNPALERHIKETHLREDHIKAERCPTCNEHGEVGCFHKTCPVCEGKKRINVPEFKVCPTCEGRGQMEECPPFMRLRGRETCMACPDCEGFGSVEKKVWERSQQFPPPRREGEKDMIGNVNGGRSKLLEAPERTTLEGGKDIIKRALNTYVKKHKGDPDLNDALESIRTEFVRLAYQGKVPE